MFEIIRSMNTFEIVVMIAGLGSAIILAVSGFLLYFVATPEERRLARIEIKYGPRHLYVICPHCATKGQVYSQTVNRKGGLSGGKAAGAVLTGGVSVLVTGLSRNEQARVAYCDHCKMAWDV